jgi:hypothetical protein
MIEGDRGDQGSFTILTPPPFINSSLGDVLSDDDNSKFRIKGDTQFDEEMETAVEKDGPIGWHSLFSAALEKFNPELLHFPEPVEEKKKKKVDTIVEKDGPIGWHSLFIAVLKEFNPELLNFPEPVEEEGSDDEEFDRVWGLSK